LKLFIIGNGFDIAHGMKTKYSDFKRFLEQNYPNAVPDYNLPAMVPEPYETKDGGEEYDENVKVEAIIRILDTTEGGDWRDVETSLGMLDYSEFLDNYNDYLDDEGDIDEKAFRDEFYNNGDNARYLCGALASIPHYFSLWANKIRIRHKKLQAFSDMINKYEDLFLNFNYTLTLEKLYGAKNVCHIHGQKGDEELYFGHGNDRDKTDDYQIKWFGAEGELISLESCLRKNTFEAYSVHKDFFKKIKDVDEVYTFGFSYSPVDEFYINIICKVLKGKNASWFMNDFDNMAKRKEFTSTLKKCGFDGKTGTFHIDCCGFYCY